MPLRFGFAPLQPVGGLPLSSRKQFSLWDTWLGRGTLYSQSGILFNRVSRETSTPPPSGNAYLKPLTGGAYETLYQLVLPPSSVVTSSCYVRNNSGGGTGLRATVQSGSTFFGNSGAASWGFAGPIVQTVGTDGLWRIEGIFEYWFADLVIYVSLPG